MSRARQLVDALRAQTPPTSYNAIAKASGQSKATVVLWYTGKYPANPQRVEDRICAAYDTVACPYLGADLPRPKCAEYQARALPTAAPKALDHYRACQRCIHKTTQEATP